MGSSEYRYHGKDRTQIPQIWRCIDGRRQQVLEFVKITSSYDKRVQCKDKSDKSSEFTLSDENWSQLKAYRLEQAEHKMRGGFCTSTLAKRILSLFHIACHLHVSY